MTELQIFVKGVKGATNSYNIPHAWTLRELKTLIHDREGVPINDQVISCGGRRLQDLQVPLTLLGVSSGTTVHMSAQLQGGKPVKVKMLTPHIACGGEVVVDAEEGSRMLDIKRQLQKATGVPLADQKVMLSGVGQMVMGDKRTNLRFGSCGTANSISMAVQAADKPQQ